jgi:ribosome biogenesis GTPase
MSPLPERLLPLGWDEEWERVLATSAPGARAGRVLLHHGVALVLALPEGIGTIMLTQRLRPAPTVGDWVAVADDEAIAVLSRRSLLRRRTAHGDGEQQLAANIDMVLLVCGLDRPVKDGRIQRGTAIAHDAGARPVVVLTKASRPVDGIADAERAAAEVREAHPGVEVLCTSVKEGEGVEELRRLIGSATVTLLGESGAGKSSIVNALLGSEVAATGAVRDGDAKGRHTTTSRELHLLPGGGVLIDTPGIRAVGLVTDTEAVAETFTDIDDLAETCRFADCQHEGQPGCAIAAGLEADEITVERVAAWRRLRDEAAGSSVSRPRWTPPPPRARRRA